MNCCNKTDATLVEYTGRCLENIGVAEGHTLDHALKRIDAKIETLSHKVDNDFIGLNLGDGAKVYKDKGQNGSHTFRTLKVGKGIKLTETDDTIVVAVDETLIKELVLGFYNEARRIP